MPKQLLILKEITEESQLKELLKLRYDLYQKSSAKAFSPPNQFSISLDIWDLYSRHFGIFYRTEGEEQLIGCLRLIESSLTFVAPTILNIAIKEDSDFASKIIETPRNEIIPSAIYFAEALNPKDDEGLNGIEVGRFAIKHSFRKKYPTAMIIMQLIAGLCIYHFNYDFACIICKNKHAPMYKSLGFLQVSNENKLVHNMPSVCMKIFAKNIKKEVLDYLKIATEHYSFERGVAFDVSHFED